MDVKKLHTVYFLGIGGIGMSAIARYFLAMGCEVFGYDKTATELTRLLEEEGAKIHYKEDLVQIPEPIKQQQEGVLVVYTPAIPRSNLEYQFFMGKAIQLYKRSEVLGLISQDYFTIAIAGTHGKTTTSSIVAHVLDECKKDCIAFLGGISLNFNSNLLLNEKAKILVVEADEFDRSFLTLSPDIALITSLDADHLDIYGDKEAMRNSYQAFVKKIKKGGLLITKNEYLSTLDVNDQIHYKSYSIEGAADCHATTIQVKEGNYFLDVKTGTKQTTDIQVGLPGIHNVENALGAFAIAHQLEIDHQDIKMALGSYKGVQRRFEYQIKTPDLVYIDDYAHHPTELEVCIRSIKELYPSKKISGIFQPHLFSRTRDFAAEFSKSLSLLDELILLDIYPARELPIAGVSSQIILDKVSSKSKQLLKKEELMACVKANKYEVLLTLGAGDIAVFVKQIKEVLMSKIDHQKEVTSE